MKYLAFSYHLMNTIFCTNLSNNAGELQDGQGANVKRPFSDIDLTMHELSPSSKGFKGQLGFIEFTSELRLPRHIHMDASKQQLVDERILVLSSFYSFMSHPFDRFFADRAASPMARRCWYGRDRW